MPGALARNEYIVCKKSKTKLGGCGYEKLTVCDLESVATALVKYSNECDDEYFTLQVGQLSISIVFFQKYEGLPEVVYSTKSFFYNVRYETKETMKSIGKMIRQELPSAPDVVVSWPPRENQLLQGNFQTPELTNLSLTSILSGKSKSTKRNNRLVHSIAQDLTYNSSMGRRRTKKHVELGVCIKRITGSVDAARWLNHFGYSISYDEINAL